VHAQEHLLADVAQVPLGDAHPAGQPVHHRQVSIVKSAPDPQVARTTQADPLLIQGCASAQGQAHGD
jgi:hypothetical protein